MKTLVQKATFLNVVIIVSALLSPTYSQTDTSHVVYSQENADSSDYNYKRKYMYLDINMQEENKMLSVGIAPSTIYRNGYSSDYGIGVLSKFDKKISPSLSIYTEIVGMYSDSENDLDYEDVQSIEFSSNIGVRYYYNQNKNIKANISSSNFNGPYIDLKINSLLSYYSFIYNNRRYTNDDDTRPLSYNASDFEVRFPDSFTLAYGYQQKLTNYLYMDGNLFFIFHYGIDSYFDNNIHTEYSNLLFGLSCKFGFGWGWK